VTTNDISQNSQPVWH